MTQNPLVEQGRILFVGNPWPQGHEFGLGWDVRISRDGLYFDFYGDTDDYCTDDEESEEEDDDDSASDWSSKAVWSNYHACEISSEKGIKVADEANPMSLTKLTGRKFTADPLPVDVDEEMACRIYLLGHDSIANHEITFDEGVGPHEYAITWKGKIALTYSGDTEFKYDFIAKGARSIECIVVDEGLEEQDAQILLHKFVEEANLYEMRDGYFYLKK